MSYQCDHEKTEALLCGNCSGLMGEICVDCGTVTDGGATTVADEELWCACDAPEQPSFCLNCQTAYYETDGPHECHRSFPVRNRGETK